MSKVNVFVVFFAAASDTNTRLQTQQSLRPFDKSLFGVGDSLGVLPYMLIVDLNGVL